MTTLHLEEAPAPLGGRGFVDRDLLRRARARPVRRRRLVVGGLSLRCCWVSSPPACCSATSPITIPDFFRILVRRGDPRRVVHPDGEQAAEGRARRARRRGVRGRAARSSRPRCATRSRAPTSSASASARARPPSSRSSRSTSPGLRSRSPPWSVRSASLPCCAAGRRRTAAGTGWCWSGSAWRPRCTSVIQYLFTRADVYDAQLALRWLTGSVNGADWPTHPPARRCCCAVRAAGDGLARAVAMRITELGGGRRRRAGRQPGRRTDLLLAVAVVLTAVAVAAAGPIAFVSFLAGPIARACNQGRTIAGRCRTGRRRSSWWVPTTWPTTCWPTSTSPSVSSPARSGRRSCSGCSPAAVPEGEWHDRPGRQDRVTRGTAHRPARRRPGLARVRRTAGDRTPVRRRPGRQGHRHRRSRTPAASPRCCAGWPGCCGRRPGAVLLDGDRHPSRCRPGRWPQALGCCPRTRSHPRGSPSSTWSAGVGTRTRARSVAGRAEDEVAVAEALALTDTTDLADRVGRRALRRSAAAGLDRDGAGPGHRPAAARRAHDVPRRRPPGRDARPAARPQPGTRHAPS